METTVRERSRIVIIDKPVGEILREVEWRIQRLIGCVDQEYNLQLLQNKKRALLNYQKGQSEKTSYQKLLYLKSKDPDRWVEECVKLTKGVKYVYFNRRSNLFRVQKKVDGRTKYIGEFETIDDAREMAEMFFSK